MSQNPPQITWQSALRQRMFDFLNAHSINEGSTERGEEIILLAIKEIGKLLPAKSPKRK